jgi:hypothetical protein
MVMGQNPMAPTVFLLLILVFVVPAYGAEYDQTTSIAPEQITCDIKGTQKVVNSVNVCNDLGGTVVETPEVPKQA